MERLIQDDSKISLHDFAESIVSTNLCRLCLGNDSVMYEIEYVEDNYAEDFQDITGIVIEENDFLPLKICKNCLDSLIAFSQFRRKCKTSENRLKRLKHLVPEIDFQKLTQNNDKIKEKIIECLSKMQNSKFKKEPCIVKATNSSDVEVKVETDDEYESMNYDNRSEAMEASEDLRSSKKKSDVKKSHTDELRIVNPYKAIEDDEALLKLKLEDPEAYKKEKKKLICGLCNKIYADTHCLKMHHNRSHVTEKKFVCHECGKAFSNMPALKSHQTVHSDFKQFACKLCGHRTRLHSGMVSHMRSHSSDRRHVCSECGETFKRASQLNRHANKHRESFPFDCKLCSKRFRDDRNLNDHVNAIHKGLRKYTCELCPAAFGYREPLRHHRRVAHSETKTPKAKERELEREVTMTHDVVSLAKSERSNGVLILYKE